MKEQDRPTWDEMQRDAMPEAENLADLKRRCDDWNAANPVGTPVILKKDVGPDVHTRTRTEAQVLSGHSAVIWLEGIVGCYGLERVIRK